MAKVEFNNRVFGGIVIRSINSNFNADFTRHPRTLPDGVVYSTDKALKYAVKDYFRKLVGENSLFYVKRYNENLNPLTLDETYRRLFGDYQRTKGKQKDEEAIDRLHILTNLLKCLDVRLFGATFAGEANISIHGPVQINHGVNRYPENELYTEDILSPFRNPGDERKAEKEMSTIGNQTNLKEGHYVFHFSVNPRNTFEFYEMINKDKTQEEKVFLSDDDIAKLKDAFNRAVTALDSTRKIGTENEATIWIQLKKESKKMFPSLTELVNVTRADGKVQIDCRGVKTNIDYIAIDVESVEVYYNPSDTVIVGLEKGGIVRHFNILNNLEI